MKITFKKSGAGGAYYVFADGVKVGFVQSSWRKIYGGACWTVKDQGKDKYFFTRKEAAVWLAQTAQAGVEATA